MTMDFTCHDARERRCPRLGHLITFAYCKTSGVNQQSCFKILDCWWEIFDVVGFLKTVLPQDRINKLFQPEVKPKVTSLLELIEQAKQNVKES